MSVASFHGLTPVATICRPFQGLRRGRPVSVGDVVTREPVGGGRSTGKAHSADPSVIAP